MRFVSKAMICLAALLVCHLPARAQGPMMASDCCEPTCLLFSLDATLGYGRIQAGDEALVHSSLLGPILSQILNTNNSSGGFAWRVFGNGIVRFSRYVAMGGELGFSYYPSTKQSQMFVLNVDDLSLNIGRSVDSRGYGTDLLLDIFFYPLPRLSVGIKPGVQFAFQANKSVFDIDVFSAPFFFDTEASYHNTAFLPEIIVSVDAISMRGFCWINTIGLMYQHVFGHDDNLVEQRVASRDMIGLNLGFLF